MNKSTLLTQLATDWVHSPLLLHRALHSVHCLASECPVSYVLRVGVESSLSCVLHRLLPVACSPVQAVGTIAAVAAVEPVPVVGGDVPVAAAVVAPRTDPPLPLVVVDPTQDPMWRQL